MMKQFVSSIHYKKNLNAEEKIFSLFLLSLSFFYAMAVRIRSWAYSKRIIKQKKLDAFVISVGNLTTGGTGKTPITVEIANYISQKLNKKTAILSRGYGGKLSVANVNIISNGTNIFHSAHMAGDEPYWLAVNAEKIPVITGQNRYKSGIQTIKEFDTEVVLLDDGFQHLKLARDLNILVIDCGLKFGNGHLLPAGPLRESLSEIRRADKIILVNKNALDDCSEKICSDYALELEKQFKKKVLLCNFKNVGIYDVKTGHPLEAKQVVYAFAGIGRPEYFFKYLKENGLEVIKERVFSDHHMYTRDDVLNIIREASKLGAKAIVSTEKDAVKLKALLDKSGPEIPFYALKLGISLDLPNLLDNVLEELK